MSTLTRTHNIWHLGDNLVHLNFLRRVASANPDRNFVHHAQHNYLPQLRDVVRDIPNIKLEQVDYQTPPTSIDAWRGESRFWFEHPNRNDFVTFHLEWFDRLAKRMHVENPVRTVTDMLFDYPAILQPLPQAFAGPFDVLVINSAPGSGQFRGYNEYALTDIAGRMGQRGHQVIITNPVPPHFVNVRSTTAAALSVSEIGHLSLHCPIILMISTGPSWPTFNIWNRETVKERIILLTTERVNMAPNTHHCESIPEATAILQQHGLL